MSGVSADNQWITVLASKANAQWSFKTVKGGVIGATYTIADTAESYEGTIVGLLIGDLNGGGNQVQLRNVFAIAKSMYLEDLINLSEK